MACLSEITGLSADMSEEEIALVQALTAAKEALTESLVDVKFDGIRYKPTRTQTTVIAAAQKALASSQSAYDAWVAAHNG